LRPLSLTVEGLACFRDRQHIDFRLLDLFAISGPTGAGKSTLLDAMIFALYGEIPRVNLQNRTEMIAAACNRVAVTLDFEVGARRYRISRTLRRSGAQMVRLEEQDEGGSFKAAADQVRTATDRVAQILGLGASAFMQSVVLPQGEFASFLKAPPRERRGMLRTLLRLDVYERMREQAQRLSIVKRGTVESLRRVLEDEYGGIDEAALAALEADHVAIVELLADLRRRRDEIQTARVRVQGLHAKTVELHQLEKRRTALQRQAEQVKLEQARLDAATRAAPLVPQLEEAARAFAAATAATNVADEARGRNDAAQQDWQARSAALAAAEQAAKTIRKLRAKVARLHQVVGRLPERAQLQEDLHRQQQDLATLDGERSSLAAAVAAAQTTQAAQRGAVERARQAAATSGYDAELDELLQGERDRAVELGAARRIASERRTELTRKRQAAEKQGGEVAALLRRAEPAGRSAARLARAVEAADQALQKTVRLHEANHLREQLLPGEPCPVCGQGVEVPPAVHLAPEIEAARAALQAARQKHADADARTRQATAALTGAEARLAAARQDLGELEARCAQLQARVTESETAIFAALGERAPRGGGAVEAWIERQTAALAKSRKADAEARAHQAAAERELDKARADEAAARERLGEKDAQRARLKQTVGASRERLAAVQAEIRAVTRSADPAAEAAGLDEQIQQLETDLKAAAEKAAGARNRLAATEEAQRYTAEAALATLETALQRAESRDAEIARAGFADEAAVRKALLSEAIAARLWEQIQRQLQDTHAVESRLEALSAELGSERVSDQQLAAVENLVAEVTTEVEAALGQEKRLEEQTARTRERLGRLTELREQLAVDLASLRVHELLAGDLRSDRFQAYLLQEVFTDLVRGASARLRTLTGERYTLRFIDDEIRVVDHDNGDEMRISDTLSGGETFLTALALALELSDQVQRAAGAVNLDSLFIDEGFGTLDPDTLALVSETLQNLRVGGRMIGIITHIPELRDEFAQQIIVLKHQGYSTVEIRGLLHSV
jgi:exonuclease SbcC